MTSKKAIITAICILALAGGARAAELYVPDDYDTIQAAIDAAYDGDTVIVADGTYTGEGNRDIDFLGKAITVRSESGAENCIIDCNGTQAEPHRGFYFWNGEDASSVLRGFSIIRGHPSNASDSGSGIRCEESSPTIANCIITDNKLIGIYCYKGGPTITNCAVAGNEGPGIFCHTGSNILIRNCTVSGNSDRSWRSRGGGIRVHGFGARAAVNNCIVWANTAENGNQIAVVSGGSLDVSYSNVTTEREDIEVHQDSELNWGLGNIHADPCFVQAGYWHPNDTPNDTGDDFWVDGDYHLSTPSPCINTGDPGYSPPSGESDIDGEPRLINGRIDIGSDEFDYEGPLIGLSPLGLEFFAREGATEGQTQVMSIHNSGPGMINWQVKEDCSWTQVEPSSGVSNGELDNVSVTVDPSLLTLGSYTCELTITSDEALNSPRTCSITLYVKDGDGLLYVPSEYLTIQEAVDAAAIDSDDTVIVADGTYTGDGNRDIDFLGKAITVKSENGPRNCIIDCQGTREQPHRGFQFYNYEDDRSILDGFTITNGWAEHGGGITCYFGSPTVQNCIVKKNKSEFGGGVYSGRNEPTFRNCTIAGNITTRDQLDGSIGGGGGFYCYVSGITITNCTISNNVATGAGVRGGGGIFFYTGNLTVNKSKIIGNSSDGLGGGIYARPWPSSSALISNCIVADNHAENGGAVYFGEYSDARPVIRNCTISGNSATDRNGGIYGYYGEPYIFNSIIWGNTPAAIYGLPKYCDLPVRHYDPSNIKQDPLFVNPGGGNYHLRPNSPCINTGDPNYIAGPDDTDIDGEPRVMGGRVDMGVDEFTIPNTSPVACIVGGNQAFQGDSDCRATITLNAACSSDADSTAGTNDDIIAYDWYQLDPGDANYEDYLGSGEVIKCNLGLGEHLIVLEVADKAWAFDSNEVVITVEDVTPPELSVSVEPNVLWPPNHKMVKITPSWEVSDNCDESPEVSLVDVTMSAEGNMNDHVQIGDDGSIYLRAKRGKGNNIRVYTLIYEAVDNSGNTAVETATVSVLNSRRKTPTKQKPIDQAQPARRLRRNNMSIINLEGRTK